MDSANVTRVRIIKEGVLFGQEGVVDGVDGDMVVVLLPDETTVGVNRNDVRTIQPSPIMPPTELSPDFSDMIQVKLPTNAVVTVNGHEVISVLCVVRMTATQQDTLQEYFDAPLPEVHRQGNAMDEAAEDSTPSGPPLMGTPFAVGMPNPTYPPYGVPVMGQPSDQFVKLSLARQLMEAFMNMRHHMVAAAGPQEDDDEITGDEWKRKGREAGIFTFAEHEVALYKSACCVLGDFLEGKTEDE